MDAMDATTSFEIQIATSSQALAVNLTQEQNTLFVLGANGSGKSALLQHLYVYPSRSLPRHRITAHRQTWFNSGTTEITGKAFQDTVSNIRQTDSNTDSRYLDLYASSRPTLVLFTLIQRQIARSMGATSLIDEGETESAVKYLAEHLEPIDIINKLFLRSHLDVEVFVAPSDPQTIMARRIDTAESYGIEQLSDGERSALLLAAEVLTASEGSLLLIDEPERHLHRSIISPLLSELFAARSDCYFVIATHDVLLPQDCGEPSVVVLRGCQFSGRVGQVWEAYLASADLEMDDDIKADIWGARRKLLYVEGKPSGIDERLYSTIFPHVTVKAKGSCTEVIQAVRSARSAGLLHWVEVFGLIDGDQRDQQEIDSDKNEHIYTLPVRAVESLYYCEEIREAVGRSKAELIGASTQATLTQARQKIIANANTMKKLDPQEQEKLNRLVTDVDDSEIVARFPIGRSKIPYEVATSLHFTNQKQYQGAACVSIRRDSELRDHIASLCGDIRSAL